jgi:hypothetical protein
MRETNQNFSVISILQLYLERICSQSFFATIFHLFSITCDNSLKIKGINYWRESHPSMMKFLESFTHERVAQEPGCKRPVVRRRANSSLYESMWYSASARSWVGTRYSIVEPSVSSEPV